MSTLIKGNLGLLILLTLFSNVSNAGSLNSEYGCNAKKRNLEQQIRYAKAYGNSRRAEGLESALREVNRHCSDASLLQNRQDKVHDKELKVARREIELNYANEIGIPDKIPQKKVKLEEAKKELSEAKAALSK